MATILCVEDEQDIRDLLVEELEAAGHQILDAGNGQEALSVLQRQTPDLILCDIGMPIMDGYEFLDAVRAGHPELAHTPFVFLTALSDREQVINGKARGADDYLTKPIDYSLLHATVDARLLQIERIRAKDNERLIKLYRHLSSNSDKTSGVPGSESPKDAAFRNGVRTARNPQTGEVTVGRFQLIGLHAVKRELGSHWDDLAERVRAFAEGAIKEQLSEGDSYNLNDRDEFIVCFASLNQEEAWYKAKSIEREIHRKIMGDKQVEDLARSGPECVETSRIAETETDVRTVEIDPDELENTPDVADLMVAKLRSAARKVKAQLKKAMVDVSATCDIVFRAVRTRTGGQAPMQIEDFDAETYKKLDEVRNLANGAQDVAAEVDVLALGKAAQHVLDNANTSLRPIMVDASYSTLIDRANVAKLQRLCGELGDFATKYLIMVVSGVPKGVENREMEAMLSGVRKWTKYQALRVNDISEVNAGSLRFPVVVLDHERFLRIVAKNEKAVMGMIAALREKRVRVLIDKVPKSEFMEFVTRYPIELAALNNASSGDDSQNGNGVGSFAADAPRVAYRG